MQRCLWRGGGSGWPNPQSGGEEAQYEQNSTGKGKVINNLIKVAALANIERYREIPNVRAGHPNPTLDRVCGGAGGGGIGKGFGL